MGLVSGVLKKLKIYPEIKIYFQRWPTTDAASGIADLPYTFQVEGSKDVKNGVTASDGSISIRLADDKKGILKVLGTVYHVKVQKSLEAVDKVKGVQQRLATIGYGPGAIDAVLGPKMERAALNFQADHNPLDTDGITSAADIVDTKTKDELKKAAGA
jgi:hypothetical protein